MAERELIEGVTIKMGGKEWVVPPLTLPPLRRFLQKGKELRKAPQEDGTAYFDLMVEAVLAAMRRNYPDLTKDTLEEFLDLGNIPDVFAAIAGRSGLILGEMLAGSRKWTGAPSTPTSPQPQDGLTERLTA
jgi:hypothetical protein